MPDPFSFDPAPPAGTTRRGRPRKHDDAYGEAAGARISVRNFINWGYARRGAEALGFSVINAGPRPIAIGPPALRMLTGTTVLTEIGRALEMIGPARTVDLAHRVAAHAEATGLDANRTAKLIRQLRSGEPEASAPSVSRGDPPDPPALDAAPAPRRLAG